MGSRLVLYIGEADDLVNAKALVSPIASTEKPVRVLEEISLAGKSQEQINQEMNEAMERVKRLRSTVESPITPAAPKPTIAIDEGIQRNTEFITDIQKLKASGETISSSQMDALEAAYRTKGGDDLSLLNLMGYDGDKLLETEMDKLYYGSDMQRVKPPDAPSAFYDIDMEAEPAKPWRGYRLW